MDVVAARQLALDLMRAHALVGWSFAFDHARRRFGCCRWRDKVITLSKPLTFLNSEDQVRETILHEIAHALTPGDGHGLKWRAKCRELGIKPERCYGEAEVVSPPRSAARYVIGCKRCGWWHERRRATRNRLICRHCASPVHYRDRFAGIEFIAGAR